MGAPGPARSRWGGGGLVALAACLPLAGCAEELGVDRERFPTATVRGRLLVGGRPVGGGFIEVGPDLGTPGNLRVGPIRPDGTFELDRVPTGRVVIGLSRLPADAIPGLRAPIDPRAFAINRRPIRRTIPPGAPTHEIPPIDLIDEAARSLRRPSGRRRRPKGSGGGGADSVATVPPPKRSRPAARRPAEPPSGGDAGGALTVRILYRAGSGEVHADWPADRLGEALGDAGGVVWVDVADLGSAHNAAVETLLRETFRFHPLAIEDALKDVHVPRVDDWANYLYLVVDTLDFDPDTDEIRLHELDLFLGANFLLSYHHEPVAVLDRYRAVVEHDPAERLRGGPSFLLYQLLDDVVAEFGPTIEHLDDAIDDAQDEVFTHARPSTLRRIFQVKGSALRLHRIVAPMREVLNRLARDPYSQVREEHRVYFRDVYDHLVRVHDTVESLRDLIAGAIDTYLSVVSNRTNDIMKVLTLLNVMFLPMTFIAGFFGMNFFGETLTFTAPALPKTLLFWLTVLAMAIAPAVIWVLARLRGWF